MHKKSFVKYYILIFLIINSLMSCTTSRLIAYNVPQAGDMEHFPSVVFPASPAAHPLPALHNPNYATREFEHFLHSHHTTALLMIQNDTIRLEYYAPGIHPDQQLEVFSVSKSIVAGVMAIAQQEGYIHALTDKISDYIPHPPRGYENISLLDLLNMRSGIKTTLYNSAWFYYSSHLNKSLQRLPLESQPGSKYEYSNATTQWLVSIIEKATGQKFSEYFYEKFWKPLHMESPGSWSLDSRQNNTVRGFCGLNLSIKDLVRIGNCYLHNGYSEGQQILPASWLQKTFSPPLDGKQNSDDFIYHMHWRIITPNVEFLAKGLFGQYMYINKAANTVVIRLGTQESSVAWIPFFRQLTDYRQTPPHLRKSIPSTPPYPDLSNVWSNNN